MARVKAKQVTYVNGERVVTDIEIEDNTDNPWLCGNSNWKNGNQKFYLSNTPTKFYDYNF